ncbi:MAG: hypothetical protein ACRDF4_02140 [Rhabdochlamydiaceae bacterium]
MVLLPARNHSGRFDFPYPKVDLGKPLGNSICKRGERQIWAGTLFQASWLPKLARICKDLELKNPDLGIRATYDTPSRSQK